MVKKYNCEKCGKEFNQKGHYTKHLNKKNPCVIESKVKEMLDKSINDKLNQIYINSDSKIEIKNDKVDIRDIEIKNEDGLKYLSTFKDDSVNLILTDPPYIIFFIKLNLIIMFIHSSIF